jgi:hypothetical protein
MEEVLAVLREDLGVDGHFFGQISTYLSEQANINTFVKFVVIC